MQIASVESQTDLNVMTQMNHFKRGILIGIALLLIYTIASSIIAFKNIKWIHESGVVILSGLVISFGFYWISDFSDQATFSFDPSVFFYCVLPPIIFAAGYNLKRRRFFQNFGGISLFGVVSTILIFFTSAGLNLFLNEFYEITIQVYSQDDVSGIWKWTSVQFTARDILLMSALLCSSDTVAALTIVKEQDNPKLFSLIFGEGIFNDAISIILFQTVTLYTAPSQKFTTSTPFSILMRFFLLSLVSISIGIIYGLVCAVFLKKFRFLTHDPVSECVIVFLFGLLSYITAELLNQSGILALLFNGVVLAHYAWYNLSPQAKHGTSLAFQMIGFCCEALVFAYLGLVFFFYIGKPWSFSLIAFQLPIICIARYIGIFGLIFCIKVCCCKKPFLTVRELTFQGFAGLIRGPIAFGLVLRLQADPYIDQTKTDIIITTTLSLVIFTTVVFGSIMPFLSKCLLDKHSVHHEAGNLQNDENFVALNDCEQKSAISAHQPFLHPNIEYANQQSHTLLPRKGSCKYYWKQVDHVLMKPIFIYKYDRQKQKRDFQFFHGFMKKGHEWAEEYRESGDVKLGTVARQSNFSKSSEGLNWPRKLTMETEKQPNNTDETNRNRSSSFQPENIVRQSQSSSKNDNYVQLKSALN